ncbi:MAG: hypothetical protein OXC07_11385 [Kistimonas sp.]|nr:hypothetical protein [Kistimonas sp.]
MNAPLAEASTVAMTCFDMDTRFINPLHDRPPSPEQHLKGSGKGLPARTLVAYERTVF